MSVRGELVGAHLAWLSCCCLLLIHYLPSWGAVTALNIHLRVDPRNVTINHCHPSLSVCSLSFFSLASLFIFLTICSLCSPSFCLTFCLSFCLAPSPLTPHPHLLSSFFFSPSSLLLFSSLTSSVFISSFIPSFSHPLHFQIEMVTLFCSLVFFFCCCHYSWQ